MPPDPGQTPAAAHNTPGPASPGPATAAERERRLAAALADLVRQIDVDDYRDGLGHPLRNNLAFLRAQAICDDYGVGHDDIRRALGACEGDMARAARDLAACGPAQPGEAPPEYRTWTTGP
ncbi:hypothetical protein [Phenylobacterium sp.]|uniref:hypothetical protein n=1 Tax=Phenylobacterium sp. TaxID=1871053 RepID=UPI0035ADA7FA